jgi:PIN domain nuclease of toxin-antitoxin system
VNLLLDTHAALWFLADDPALDASTRELIEDGRNLVAVSAASVWEVAIKRGLGKLKAPAGFAATVTRVGFNALAITHDHAERAGRLPAHHRDPFDRMLVAQAQTERLTVVSRDAVFNLYDVDVRAC